MENIGRILRIHGPVITLTDIKAKIGDVILLGEWRLISEAIRIFGDHVVVQCYEDVSGLKPGDPAWNTGRPLVVELGPGLIGSIYDGLQFDEKKIGAFWERGLRVSRLDKERKWEFIPIVKKGEKVSEGDIIGVVPETRVVQHRILVPPGLANLEIVEIYEGKFTVTETIAIAKTKDGKTVELKMMQEWPIRVPRPYKTRVSLTEPLVTGQRVIDTFFPIAKGGTAAIPGGFGTGKTVTLQQLAKWSDADINIYIGCGERGNEMAEALHDFSRLVIPRAKIKRIKREDDKLKVEIFHETGVKLVERAIFIANVSNLPVYAREASIYTGVTIGEYFRDQGYDVALMADSTSRWAEALRDIAGRLEEIPVERGFPAYLAERIAQFYERAGRVVTLGTKKVIIDFQETDRIGSLTIMGAVSPPGGDFSEPVTAITSRFVSVLWALDKELAFKRHFPAINWLLSFSYYVDLVRVFWERYDPEWYTLRGEAMKILEEASEIEQIARIVGEKALPEEQRLILQIADLIKEGFLIQNAFHEVDTYCRPEKQTKMLRVLIEFYKLAKKLVDNGVPVDVIFSKSSVKRLYKMRLEGLSVERVCELAEKGEFDKIEEESRKELQMIDEMFVAIKKDLQEIAKMYEIKL